MSTRLVALAALTLLASGCVEERVVHDRPVMVERPVVRREVVEEVIVAPQPPPPRVVEVVETQPRPGYVWARGYWRWNGREYVQVPGHWEVARPGYHYVHPHYEHHNDGWHLNVGVWVND